MGRVRMRRRPSGGMGRVHPSRRPFGGAGGGGEGPCPLHFPGGRVRPWRRRPFGGRVHPSRRPFGGAGGREDPCPLHSPGPLGRVRPWRRRPFGGLGRVHPNRRPFKGAGSVKGACPLAVCLGRVRPWRRRHFGGMGRRRPCCLILSRALAGHLYNQLGWTLAVWYHYQSWPPSLHPRISGPPWSEEEEVLLLWTREESLIKGTPSDLSWGVPSPEELVLGILGWAFPQGTTWNTVTSLLGLVLDPEGPSISFGIGVRVQGWHTPSSGFWGCDVWIVQVWIRKVRG